MDLSARRRTLALRRPLRFGWGTLTERELVEVALSAGDGPVGRGEAAPLEGYDGVSVASVLAALDAYARVLAACGPGADHRECLDRCREERDLPQALAAVDLALWDLEAKRAGVPVARLLHPGAASAVPVNALADDPGNPPAGFGCVKVKVGTDGFLERVTALREAAGPAVAIRVDANGAWPSPAAALEALRALEELDIELCEEPVHGEDALHAVARSSPVPIACDETWAPGLHAVALKITRSGGISGLLDAAAEARAAGSAVYVTSTFDGPVGVAAAVHAAAALAAEGPVLACGLATLEAFEGLSSGAQGGVMPVPPGPGLL